MASTGKYDGAPSHADVVVASSAEAAAYGEELQVNSRDERSDLLDQAQTEGILQKEEVKGMLESEQQTLQSRQQHVEKLHETVAQLAHKHTNNLQFYELPLREQQTRVNQILSQFQSEFGLSDREASALRETYSDALTVAHAERERQSVRLLSEARNRSREIAGQSRTESFEEGRTTAQVRSDVEKLRAEFGGKVTKDEWEQISSAYLEERSLVRRAALMDEVRRAARSEARRAFDHDPSDGPNTSRIRSRLASITEKYADVEGIADLEDTIQQTFRRDYERRHNYLYNSELNWAQRRYYDIKGWASSVWNAVTGFTARAVSAAKKLASAVNAVRKAVTHTAIVAAKGVGKIAVGAVRAVGKAVIGTANLLTNPATYKKIWDTTCNVCKAVSKAVVQTTLFAGTVAKNAVLGLNSIREAVQQIGVDIVVGTTKLSWKAAVGTVKLLTDPQTWVAVGKGIYNAGKFLVKANLAVMRFAKDAVVGAVKFLTSPETWKSLGRGMLAVGRFGVRFVTGSLKLTKDAIVGTAKFLTNPETWKALGRGAVALAKFNVKATIAALKFAKDAVVGTVKILTNPATWKAVGKGLLAIAKFNVRMTVEALKLAKNAVVATAKFLTSPETWKAVGRGVLAVGKFALELPGKALNFAKDAVVATAKFLTHPETWKALGRGIVATGKFIIELPRNTVQLAKDLVLGAAKCIADPAAWAAIGRGLIGAVNFLKDPKNWTKIGDVIKEGWAKLKSPETWKNALKTLNAIREGVQQLVVDAVVGTARFIKNAAVATWNLVTDPATYKAIWNAACKVCTTVKNVTVNTVKFLTDPETWKALGNGIKAAWDFVTSPETWKKIGDGLKAAWDFATDPKTWQAVGKGLEAAWDFCANPENLKKLGMLAVGLVRDPIGTAKWLWNASGGVRRMLKGMCDSMGITDLAVGLWNVATIQFAAIYEGMKTGLCLARDIGKVLVGRMSADQLKQNFVQNVKDAFGNVSQRVVDGMRAIKGGVLVLGELTGITDCVLTVKYAMQGNWPMAALHAGFAALSAGSIIATVATAGTAAGSILGVMTLRTSIKDATKTVMKAAAKNFFQETSTQIGKATIKQLEEQLGRETFQRMLREGAEEIADQGSRELAEKILKEGSQVLTHELVEETMYKSSKEITERVLREAGLVEVVDNLVFQLLKSCDGQSVKAFSKTLQKMGLAESRSAARALAKEIKHLVRYGGADEAIQEILVKGISREVRTYVENAMEHAFKNRFRKALKGELADELGERVSKALEGAVADQAKRWGKHVDDLVEEFVESGWKGVKRGIKEAVEKLVREGVQRAFKRFRLGQKKARPRFDQKKQVVRAPVRAATEEMKEQKGKMTEIVEADEHQHIQAEDRPFKYSKKVILGNCEYNVMYQLDEDGNWHQVNSVMTRMIDEPDDTPQVAQTSPGTAFYSDRDRAAVVMRILPRTGR